VHSGGHRVALRGGGGGGHRVGEGVHSFPVSDGWVGSAKSAFLFQATLYLLIAIYRTQSTIGRHGCSLGLVVPGRKGRWDCGI
jgi:hypothetical protein